MCGLVGVVGNLFDPERKAFRELLCFDYTRGMDSTGVGLVDDRGKMFIDKELGHPANLLFSSDYFDSRGVIKNIGVKVAIGHNRSATVGKVTRENAHPFFHSPIIGAHNGTLEKYYLKNLDNHSKFEVDSEAVIYNLAKDGPWVTIPKVAGAYALTWWDSTDNKMYFIRNSKRPLHYVRSKDRDTFFWASEEWMLTVALSKNGVAYEKIETFEVDTLYSIDVTHGTNEFRKVDLVKEGKLEGFQPPVVVYTPPKTTTGTTGGNGGSTYKNPYANSNYSHSYQQNQKNNPYSAPSPKTSTEKIKKMEALVDKELRFFVLTEHEGIGRAKYFKAMSADMNDDFTIRIYAEGNKKLRGRLLKGTNVAWVGKVKRVAKNKVNGTEEVYILLDNRTIHKAIRTGEDLVEDDSIPFEEDNSSVIVGYENEVLTPEEFESRTMKGCAWCSETIDISHHKDIVWIDRDEAIGTCCVRNEELATYLPQLRS